MNSEKNETSRPTNEAFILRPSILSFTPKSYPSNGLSTSEHVRLTNISSTPLCSAPTADSSDSSIVTKNEEAIPQDYVFGSNISSRVVNVDVSHGASSNLWLSSADEHTSGSSVFTALAQAVSSGVPDAPETLEDSATKLAEANKQAAINLTEVEVFTGEEGELPVIRQPCRVYSFNSEKRQWNALGTGQFHLNDVNVDPDSPENSSDYRSRIVVRLTTTKKVLVNTLVWAQMPLALVDSRNLRIGTLSEDGAHMRSFLFRFLVDESAEKIYDELVIRKERLATQQARLSHSPASIAGRKRPAADSISGLHAKCPSVPEDISNRPAPHDSTSKVTTTQTACLNSPMSRLDEHQGDTTDVRLQQEPNSQLPFDGNNDNGDSETLRPVEGKAIPSPERYVQVPHASESTLRNSRNLIPQFIPKQQDVASDIDISELSNSSKVLETTCQLYEFDSAESHWNRHGQSSLQLFDAAFPHRFSTNTTRSHLAIQLERQNRPLAVAFMLSNTFLHVVDDRSLLFSAISVPGALVNDADRGTVPTATYRIFLLALPSPTETLSFYEACHSRIKEHYGSDSVDQSVHSPTGALDTKS